MDALKRLTELTSKGFTPLISLSRHYSLYTAAHLIAPSSSPFFCTFLF
ncbi:MAG: hypothetical protein IM534_07015 [Chitinophagaceae bacterium]|nr:hypothetical protein [Chitinophagaceae bacterium]